MEESPTASRTPDWGIDPAIMGPEPSPIDPESDAIMERAEREAEEAAARA